MTSPALGAPGTPILPDYAPVPQASLGPAVNDQGYYVGRVERNLYWVTDGDYHAAFLIGGERIQLAWHRANHSPDNIYIHFPDHDTLMLVDIALPGWVPFYGINLSEDVPGYMQAPAIALNYPWSHFICGHLGRLATREDVAVHQQYIADIEASAREALAMVNPVPYYMHYGENFWAGVKAHLDTVTERAAAPIIAKYTGVLAAADIEVFTRTTTFAIMQSLRLDSGPSGPVHP